MIKRSNIEAEARDTYVITDFQASSVADRVIGICPVRSQLIAVYEVHGTAAGQTCTLSVERLQSTETIGNGDSVVAGTIDCEATANTYETGTIVTTNDIHLFEAGDRVGLNFGTTTSMENCVVVCHFRPIDA